MDWVTEQGTAPIQKSMLIHKEQCRRPVHSVYEGKNCYGEQQDIPKIYSSYSGIFFLQEKGELVPTKNAGV